MQCLANRANSLAWVANSLVCGTISTSQPNTCPTVFTHIKSGRKDWQTTIVTQRAFSALKLSKQVTARHGACSFLLLALAGRAGTSARSRKGALNTYMTSAAQAPTQGSSANAWAQNPSASARLKGLAAIESGGVGTFFHTASM